MARIPRKFEVNYTALERAIDFLGLEWPVTIRMQGNLSAKGEYKYSFQWHGSVYRSVHRILLRSTDTKAEGSKSLWHELMHAKQCETVGALAFNREYERQCDAAGVSVRYGRSTTTGKKIPYEAEADAAQLNHHWLPLTKGPK